MQNNNHLLQKSKELARREAALDAREATFAAKTKKPPLRENLYKHITISVKTMNIIIIALTLLLSAVLLIGVFGAK